MLLLSTESLKGYGLNRIFKFAKKAGYDGIDLAVNPKSFDTLDVDYIKDISKETDMPVLALELGVSASPDDIKDTVKMAKELNCKVIVVQPPKLLNFKMIGWLKKHIPKIRESKNISIALANASSKTFLGFLPSQAMGSLTDLKKFKHVALDTARVAKKKQDLIRITRLLKKYLVHVHLSNVKRGGGYHMPDEGVLPLESFLTKLKNLNFAGAISMKIKPKYLEAGDEKKVLKHLEEAKKFYEEYFVNAKKVKEDEEE